ncbi:MAG: DUF1572 family protein [Planctomycetota bacterium JB042]
MTAFEATKRQGVKLLRERAETIRRVIGEVPEPRLFVPIAPGTNSVGNLALHLAGNVRTLIGRFGGGVPYERDRAFEFACEAMPRDELLETFDEAMQVAAAALAGMSEETWTEVPDDTPFEGESRGDLAQRSLEHLGYHTGQIVLVGRVLSMLPPA